LSDTFLKIKTKEKRNMVSQQLNFPIPLPESQLDPSNYETFSYLAPGKIAMFLKKFGFSLLLACTLPFVSLVASAETLPPTAEVSSTQTAAPAPTAAAETTMATTSPQPLDRYLVVNLKERRVYVYEGDKEIANYPVAIGKKGWETPKGNFKITKMVENPIWENPWNGKISRPGPNSPLGERWIGFWTDGQNEIGFHGTPGEPVLGQAVSHGCLWMHKTDIKALFELVEAGAPVVIQ
jgi:lipoprotein-anchoring transpeptidase ErfK/SrfK